MIEDIFAFISPEEWQQQTARLTLEEKGAYVTLIAFAQAGFSISDDASLIRHMDIPLAEWHAYKTRLLEEGLIKIDGHDKIYLTHGE